MRCLSIRSGLAFAVALTLAEAMGAPMQGAGCNHGEAIIRGVTDVGGGDYIQEMWLEHEGPGWAGRWVGTRYVMTNTYPWDITRLGGWPTEPYALPDTDAICTSGPVDAHTLVMDCEGHLGFLVQASGAITWASNGKVVGKLAPGPSGTIEINLIDWGSSGGKYRMSGQFTTTMPGDLALTAEEIGPPAPADETDPDGQTRFAFRATMPETDTAFARIALSAARRNALADGAVIEAATPNEQRLTFRGDLEARREQAANIVLTAKATFGDCVERRDMTAEALLLISGLLP